MTIKSAARFEAAIITRTRKALHRAKYHNPSWIPHPSQIFPIMSPTHIPRQQRRARL